MQNNLNLMPGTVASCLYGTDEKPSVFGLNYFMEYNKPIVGATYGMFTVLSVFYSLKNKKKEQVLVRCSCGNERSCYWSGILSGHLKSCGCLKIKRNKEGFRLKHGLSNHNLYYVYRAFLNRCYCNSNKQYHNYGGRGIRVGEEWKNDFMSFYNWAMTNGWERGLSLDRTNNNGNYEPTNCRIVTQKVNTRNRRTTFMVDYKGERKPLAEWLDELGIKLPYFTVHSRIVYGWSLEDAFYLPNNSIVKTIRPQGEDSGRSKLTNIQAVEIFQSKESQRKLAKKYPVSPRAIFSIRHGQSYFAITKNINK